MPAITGCCWPRGISTASCSLRCWGGSGRCLCQAGNGRRLRRRRDAGLLKRELLGAVSAKSPPASWNAAIERHSATQTGANGASIVRGRRRPCTRAANRSILTIAGWPKRKFQVDRPLLSPSVPYDFSDVRTAPSAGWGAPNPDYPGDAACQSERSLHPTGKHEDGQLSQESLVLSGMAQGSARGTSGREDRKSKNKYHDCPGPQKVQPHPV